MEKIQNEPLNPCEEVLAHHGILGMKWGIRRYQPYPDNYSGEGKFVGKLSAWGERRQARHKAKTNTRIKNAVETGDKKKLKKYQDEMTPEEYEKKYAETVKNGIDNAVKDRDKSALKKYKEDLNKRDYKHQKDRIEFKEAIDDDDSRKTKKLLSKVDPEDVREATDLIRSRVALQDQKLSKIRQDSELMARLDKMNSGLSKISKTASNIASISKSFGDVSKTMTEYSKTQKEAEDKKKEKEIDKIIRSGDLDKIRANEHRMNAKELSEAYDKIIQIGSEKDIKKAAPFMNNKQVTAAVQKLSQLEKLGSSSDTTVDEAKNSSAVQVVTDWINTSFDDMNLGGTSVGDLKNSFTRYEWGNTGSRVGQYGFGHSDDFTFEDVLMHHGILGMKWGVRRYQNPDGTLTKAGRERYLNDPRDFVLKKGHKISRVSMTPDDATRDGRKYVSADQEDQDTWEKHLGEGFRDLGYATFNVNYKTKKDLKVMSSVNQGKMFIDMTLKDEKFRNQSIDDYKKVIMNYGKHAYENMKDPSNVISIQIAANTKTAQQFIDKVLEKGYDAVVDTYGKDTAKEPLIILNPDKKLKKVGYSTLTKPTQDRIKDQRDSYEGLIKAAKQGGYDKVAKAANSENVDKIDKAISKIKAQSSNPAVVSFIEKYGQSAKQAAKDYNEKREAWVKADDALGKQLIKREYDGIPNVEELQDNIDKAKELRDEAHKKLTQETDKAIKKAVGSNASKKELEYIQMMIDRELIRL